MSTDHLLAAGRSGRVSMNVPAAHKTTAWTIISVGGIPAAMPRKRVATITATAAILARRLMAPCARQSSMGGPRRGCVVSQLWRRGDDRANANVASSRNGVVGTSGSRMPAIPHAVDARPNVSQSARIGMIDHTHSIVRVCSMITTAPHDPRTIDSRKVGA